MQTYLWPNPKGHHADLSGIPIIAAKGPWDLCAGPEGDYTPDAAKAEAEGRRLAATGAKIAVVEIEPNAAPPGNKRWVVGAGASPNEAEAAAKRMREVLIAFRKGFGGKVGVYDWVPAHYSSWCLIRNVGQPDKGPWIRGRNDLVGGILLPLLDFLVPVLYVYEDTLADQIKASRWMLKEAKELAGRKPVLPIIWHRRQLAAFNRPKWSKLHTSEYRALLNECGNLADGAITYTASIHTVSEDEGAWTEQFAAFSKGELF